MSGNAVGFGFQADVANTGSLLHTLTGRALKAMSDGGVDFYSVISAITLGKGIIVRESLGNTVRSHILSKGGFHSVLSKALSIGWGHKGLAVEMTNTKAGTNALLLVGALATGSSYYRAAQCFSELLSLRGCEPDTLPNVDVLKHMIEYFAPFVYDLGFSKVFENVTTTAMRMINIQARDYTQAFDRLTIHGDVAGVTGGINQLLLTSQKGESQYFITRMRGAWFAAFAAHILGMAVELRLNDTVLWASAGNNGTAIFELGEHQISQLSVQSISNHRIELLDPSDRGSDDKMVVEHLVGEMFESFVAREPKIDPAIWEGVRRGICQISSNKLARYFSDNLPRDTFKHEDALRETLEAFGFDATIADSAVSCPKPGDDRFHLDILDDDLRKALSITCGWHGGHHGLLRCSLRDGCLCKYVGEVIYFFVEFVMNFMWCRFDAKSVRIRDDLFESDTHEGIFASWTMHTPDIKKIMANIMMITCGENTDQLNRWAQDPVEECYTSMLGFSGGRYTVGYTFLLQNDCYDNQGRFISLWPGRASVNNAMRPVITEESDYCSPTLQLSPLSTVAPGSFLEPHYRPSDVSVCMSVSMNEHSILVEFRLRYEKRISDPLPLASSVGSLVGSHILWCPHDPKARFRVEKGQILAVDGFYSSNPNRRTTDGNNRTVTQLFALHGNKLEQAVMAGYLGRHHCIIQTLGCLKCCVSAAENSDCGTYVIMGG
ncbi:uncharacterized protein F4807DRAFT_292987 [Annulohypoxylon truncatum]|uniref:uncharacterized protein n=1 Tax=Annulohypoxylon truncatum TaxID=327061 RepID=UPI002008D768|nr:uncharacterized protein F4807DRAFT_292987 [Annulohypoxylon truncatum]KAI1205159.1 hypothetical protein F4807DRAFT_292987 [Annulohypoxylon truncatum]